MLHICTWRQLLFFGIFSQLFLSAFCRKLYCVQHDSDPHNSSLQTCLGSRSRPISVATLTNSTSITINQNAIYYDLNCKASDSDCAGVRATFDKAIDIITSVFEFEAPLYINASFVSFCQEHNDCNHDSTMTSIGQAYPTLSYIMVDSTDNMTRMYPQALLKQFTDLAVKPNWVQYDINAEFNNEISWYFVNTSDDIKSSQTDFLRNVVHELMHGLGFMTAWSDELYTCLSPLFPDSLNRFITPISLSTINNNKIMSDYNNNQPFWGFVEFPFDKLLNYVDSNTFKPFSDLTRSLNHFANSNTTFRSMVDFANAWYKSDEYTVASQAYTKSVTNLDVLAVVNNEPVLYLETSLNPFSAGSSLCHVSQSNYLNTIEYLMVYTANTGVNLEQLNKMYSGGPFGPKLLKVLTQLGYAVHSNYNMTASRPSLSYWNPSDGLVGTNSNPSPALSVDTSGPACTPTNAATNTANATSSSVSLGHDKSWFLSLTFLFILLLLS